MPTTGGPPSLTAGDLMSRDVKAVPAGLPVREAARVLADLGVRGAPVVDASGRCVGVLSVTDLARWAAGPERPGAPLPRTCAFQVAGHEPGGREVVHCLLNDGVCPFQAARQAADGSREVVCTDPHCVPTDWQMVESQAVPGTVREVMSTEVAGVSPDVPVAELARVMLDRGVHRLLVLDLAGRPVGVVSVDDLLQVLAHPEVTAPATRS